MQLTRCSIQLGVWKPYVLARTWRTKLLVASYTFVHCRISLFGHFLGDGSRFVIAETEENTKYVRCSGRYRTQPAPINPQHFDKFQSAGQSHFADTSSDPDLGKTGYLQFVSVVLVWVDGFAIGVVRMLIGLARIRSVCESVRIANPSRRRGSQ